MGQSTSQIQACGNKMKSRPVSPACPLIASYGDIREYNQSGKQTEAQPFDLSACVSYQICGKGRVFSYPHIDHHSLLNTAFVDNGEKLWPLWAVCRMPNSHRTPPGRGHRDRVGGVYGFAGGV